MRAVTVIAISVACVLAAPSPAAAVGDGAGRARIARYLAAHPGGTPLNDNEISYAGGALVVTLAAPPMADALDCPAGWFCFYDRPGYGYPRGKLSSCGRQNLATWGWQYRTESAYYTPARGSVRFYYNNQLLYELTAGQPNKPDFWPYRNLANYVERVC